MDVRDEHSYFPTHPNPTWKEYAPEQLQMRAELFATTAQGMGRAGRSIEKNLIRYQLVRWMHELNDEANIHSHHTELKHGAFHRQG